MYISNKNRYRTVRAEDELDVMEDDFDAMEDEADVEVAEEATDLLFEAEDVAELVAEISGQPVEVTVDEDAVTFAVGDDEFIVEPDGDEEILEACSPSKRKINSSRRVNASKRSAGRRVSASTRKPVAKRVTASSRRAPEIPKGRRSRVSTNR